MRERMQHTIRFYWKTMVLRIGTSQILSGNPRPVTDDGIGRGAEISHKGFPKILPGFVVVRNSCSQTWYSRRQEGSWRNTPCPLTTYDTFH